MKHTVVWVLAMACIAGCITGPEESSLDRALARGPGDFLDMAVVGPQGDGTYVAPTTQHIDPAGDTVLFPGRPTALALSPDESMLAVKVSDSVTLLDMATREIAATLRPPESENSFYGIAWSQDGSRLWVTSSKPWLYGARKQADGGMEWDTSIALPGPKGHGTSAPGGFVLDEAAGRAYVALSRNNSVAVVDLAAGEVVQEIPVGVAPYDVKRLDDKLYVTNWGGRQPRKDDLTGPSSGSRVVIDEAGIASTGTVSVIALAALEVTREIEVELHPSGMAISPDGKRLYVANANSDTISVVNTASERVIGRWGTRPMASLPFGSAPNALAVSKDGRLLYVANGGNNCLAVLGTAGGALQGLVPTGWYPADILLTSQGTICVANAKGVGSRLMDYPAGSERLRERKMRRFGTAAGLNTHEHLGSVTFVPAFDAATLDNYTYRTAVNMRLPKMHHEMALAAVTQRKTAVPTRPGEYSPIRHVLYIIKENRTYDQIFGALPQGNGDPDLVHFGRDVTPNHHALAEGYVLLDNFYCNGVLSADGHQWTDEGYVTDYIEKSFGGWPRSYPYDGDDAMAYASSGFIWDHVLAAGLSFRNYGEMVKAQISPGDATWTDIYQDYLKGTREIRIRARAAVHGLQEYTCPTYVGFPGKVQDVYRAEEFLKEFRECEDRGAWYNFTIMLLPNDHTVGTREGYPTPRATVADNDLALGRIVEAVSRSRFWPETAIFVVQDDPQAGLDHVDGHRTVALCISPYVRRGAVVSTHYNQNSMLRTMELILGLAPMNQMNLAANPMHACFTDTPDLTPYTALPNQIPLDEMNPDVHATRGRQRYYAKKSTTMPLDDIDMADEDTLNRIIWHSLKGYDTPYPKLAQRPTVSGDYWPEGIGQEK